MKYDILRIDMNKQKEIFEDIPVPKAMAIMAVPMIISQLITLIYNLADTWFIGQTNNPYMVAGCSLVLPVFMLTIVIANLFGTGGGTLISRLLGVRREEEAGRVCAFSLWMALGAACLYSLLCFLFMVPLLRLLGASENTLGYARQYLFFVIVLGGIPSVLSVSMSSVLRSIGYSKNASFGLAMGGILNIALDPLFMFVIMPDGFQVMGAAIATMLSNICAFLYFVLKYRSLAGETVLTADIKAGLPEPGSIRSVFSVGIPAAISVLLFDLCNIIINRLASGHGDIELAAIGIVLKSERLPLNTGVGICLGMVPLLAYNYAAKNYKRMNEVFRFGRLVGLIFALVCVVLYRTFAPWIIRAFIRDPETVYYGTEFLKARCFATPLMFLSFSMVHFMQAIGRGEVSFVLAVVRQIIFNIPILLLLHALFGVMGIVWTQLVGDTLTVIVSYLIYMRIRKQEGF